MKNDNGDIGVIVIVIIGILAAAMILLCICIPLFTQDTVTLTVTEKESYTTTACNGDSKGHVSCSTKIHNLIYTDGEILQFNDCLVLWVWGSQTEFSHIKDGKTYTFKVYGYNVPWLNWYRSVISYNETETGDTYVPDN